VFYIDATSRDTIESGLKQLAKNAKVGDTADSALYWLVSQEHRWLLVYNNADDPDIDLHDYFPPCTHGDILITTRNQGMIVHTLGPDAYCRVGEMKGSDARALLFKTSEVGISADTEGVADTLIKVCISKLIFYLLTLLTYNLEFGIPCAGYCPSRSIHADNEVWHYRVPRFILVVS
jgi:hypothetical protein